MPQLRAANSQDEQFLRDNAYRLLEFGPPGWRNNDNGQMTQADIGHLLKSLHANNPDNPVFIAMDDSGKSSGFIHLSMQNDYYTGEPCAHLIDIVVTAAAEGTGIGKFLLQQAEKWAIQKNSKWITLNAFETNHHARIVYEIAGYQKEWIRYLKPLK